MDRNTIIFIALLAILFIGQFLIEGFTEEPKLLSTELERIQTYIYHPDNYYDFNNAYGIFGTNAPVSKGKTVTTEVIYNGKLWKFTAGFPVNMNGRPVDASGDAIYSGSSPLLGSTVGAPSDTNTNWKQIDIPLEFIRTFKIVEIFLENTIIGSVPISPADMISKYIQSYIYSPNKTYAKNTHDGVAVYNGNIWAIESTILGSTAGAPSDTNSNWKLLSLEEIPYKDIKDAIKNTAIAAQAPAPSSSLRASPAPSSPLGASPAPAPPKEPAPAPNPLGYTTVSLSDLLLFNARKAPNTDYSSSIQKSPLPVINANRGSPLDARVESFAAQQGIDFMRHISKRTPTNLF
jgi:hypothetical protein